MRVDLQCKACAHAWQIRDEPRGLASLRCPRCDRGPDVRVAADLASSLEDALVMLGQINATLRVQISLDSEALPEAFTPSTPD